jgi:hypothetical protein
MLIVAMWFETVITLHRYPDYTVRDNAYCQPAPILDLMLDHPHEHDLPIIPISTGSRFRGNVRIINDDAYDLN